MKLVIDIPRKEYERAKKGEWNCTIINKAVADATPLEEAIDDIKKVIEKSIDEYLPTGTFNTDLYNNGYRNALYMCLDLINWCTR